MQLLRARDVAHDVSVDQVYAGVILLAKDGRIALQQRDHKFGIRNPGKITTFGGTLEDGETAVEAALRELREELALRCSDRDLNHICDIVKIEEDGTSTRCSIWLLEDVDVDGLLVFEGLGVVRGTPEQLLTLTTITTTCAKAIRAYQLRKQHFEPKPTIRSSLTLRAKVESAAHQVNEDIGGFRSNMCWLLDGATPLDSTARMHPVSDARWLVDSFDQQFDDLAQATISLPRLVQSAIIRVAHELASSGEDFRYVPSAALCIFRLSNGVLEYLALADVTLVLVQNERTWVLDDQISEKRERYILQLERDEGPAAVREAMYDRRSRQMNQPGGYWVLANSPRSAVEARHGFVECLPGAKLFVGSDGYCRLVTLFGEYDWTQVTNLNQVEAKQSVNKLRDFEVSDGERVRYPRVSAGDDATALWLDVV